MPDNMIRTLPILILTVLICAADPLYATGPETDTLRTIGYNLETEGAAQIKTINNDYAVRAGKLRGKIKIDGIIDEDDWRRSEMISLSHMVLPYDTGRAAARSEVMLKYDERAFYLAFIFHDTVPGKRPVESLRRDFVFTDNDNFSIYIDPFNDQTTGYSFGVNAAGAQRDGSISNGNVNNLIWDCKWESATKNYADLWTGEIRIPFKSIRYKKGADHWGIQISRNDMKLNEKSAWAPVPRQFPTATLAYAGKLIWPSPPPGSGLRLSFIPYLKGDASQNIEQEEDIKYKLNFGFDAKVGFSTALNLDLTYNPDFSQAEVDDQVTNLDRYELYFPEKRQFFLENSDLFGSFGVDNIRPFFSRRIGLDAPVTGGARLSGKIGEDWRIGLMDMQTGIEGDLLARNFFVATIQKKVFARSNAGVILVNKQQMNVPADWQGGRYNRVAGVEYNLASRDNFWNAKFFGLKSFTPDLISPRDYSQGVNLTYSRKLVLVEFKEYYVGRDFNAETGYVPRTDFIRFDPGLTLKFYPESGPLEYHGFVTEVDNYLSPNGMKSVDRQISADYFFQFKSRAHLNIENRIWQLVLQKDFDPSKSGLNYLPAGNSYGGYEFGLSFTSDNRKLFKYSIHSGYGDYYNGNRWFIEGNLNYRVQPYGYISLVYSFNDLMLPAPWDRTGLWLVGTKVDATLTSKLFITTYIQYNQQADNININARFQWRYKPVSDFFIVYSDNYFPEYMRAKNRALVLKVTYWFN